MLKKLQSRKFWITMLGEILGIATALSGVGGKVGLIAGIVVAGLTGATFIITEGKIDAAGIDVSAETIKKIMALIDELKKEEDKDIKLPISSTGTISGATLNITESNFIPK